MSLLGFIAIIPSSLCIYQLWKKKYVITTDFIDTILFCGAAIVFLLLFSVHRFGMIVGWEWLTILTAGSIVEEIVKIVFLLVCFKKRLNIFHCAMFGFTFAIMEDLLQAATTSFPVIILNTITFHLHASTLIFFFCVFTYFKKTTCGFLLGMVTAVMLHLFFNLSGYTIFADWKIPFYIALFFISRESLFHTSGSNTFFKKKQAKPD